MPTLHYAVRIAATPDVVWDRMLSLESYQAWTSAFAEGSTYEGSWEAGAQIRFLAPDGSGVIAEIAESRPPEWLSIRHLGMLENGVEDFDSAAVRAWAPAYENYALRRDGHETELSIDVDTTPESVAMMNDSWPKGLAKLKELCEGRP
ncbi:MAG: SRPBCC domain-containing protein [Gemmatimonadetes bacterium]|jgi:hypothetical protein|nr:SRPBCC domain-containing protein [Gemmatimonadota bacterium]MBK6842759.1 SRPBCC domain-containing protein [Gemmatimonadota bacterium]MBK7831767.1 SRPBCC domain-containing protein [Gemmatimonadota bacterium]MBK8647570.1 SRPBCC domain-containing protein [Gemmatimonadota bacterium]